MRQSWVYIVSDDDEFELPALVTENSKEAAAFLGITHNALLVHFCQHRGPKIRETCYRVERIAKESLEDEVR